jgi:nucleoside-diphosphate-sugar epimerase
VDGLVGEVFNLGTGREISIGDVVERVFAATGKELPVLQTDERLRPPGSEVDRLCASVEKARTRLGWEPSVTFDDGLRNTIDWISTSLDIYKSTIYNV